MQGRAFALLASTILATPALAQPAPNARPTGGQVSVGAATIARAPGVTTITQSTSRAAINWQSFNVGASQTVDFVQPSSSAITLNRVIGPDPSQIAGRIDANGQLVIINQSGVVFSKGAQVNAAALVVSAPGITDANFAAGKMVFDQPAKPNAQVVNNGTITVKQSGLAALVAPQVANNGTITAKLGKVVLAGAVTSTVDLYGDGMLSLNVTGQVTQVPTTSGGQPVAALVTNNGTIAAQGGTVVLTARAVDGLVQTLVTTSGQIDASSVGTKAGKVVVSGIGGDIVVNGKVSVAGNGPGATGGQIALNASGAVTLGPAAQVTASGAAGGGTVAIGTTLARAKGGPSVAAKLTAAKTTIAKGATVTADATQSGNGGTIAILSTGATKQSGAVSAQGGPQSGNGGNVEISGATLALDGTATVIAPAPSGAPGTILLDPTRDLYVSTSANPSGANPTLDTVVSPASINAMSGNISFSAGRDVDMVSALDTTSSSISGLEFDAGRNINVAAAITTNGSLTLNAANAIDATASITAGGSVGLIARNTLGGSGYALNLNSTVSAGAGQTLSIATDSTYHFQTLNALGGTVEIGPSNANAAANFGLGVDGSGTLINASTVRVGTTSLPGALTAVNLTFGNSGHAGLNNFGAATLDVEATGTVSQYGASAIQAAGLTGTVGALNFENGGNVIPSIGPFTANGSAGSGLGGLGIATTSATLTFFGPVSATGTLDLETNGKVNQAPGSTLQIAGLTGNVGGVDFENSGNSIPSIGPLTANGSPDNFLGGIAIGTSGALSIDGPISATATLDLQTPGLVSQNTGSIQAASLTGTVGALEFDGSGNAIASVGPLAATGDPAAGLGEILLVTNTPLTIAGPISANVIALEGVGTVTLASDLTMLAGSTTYPGFVFVDILPGGDGTSNFVQTGVSHLTSNGGAGFGTMEIESNSQGSTTFNDLEGPSSALYLAIPTGNATVGEVNVGALYLFSGGGSSNLTNTTVAGQAGAAAAAATLAYPVADPVLLVNGVIAGTALTPPPVTPPPVTPPPSTPPPVVTTTPPIVLSSSQTQQAAAVASQVAATTPVVIGAVNVVANLADTSLQAEDSPAGSTATTGSTAGGETQQGGTPNQKGVPLVNPLGQMANTALGRRVPDPDLLVPNVSEQDY